MIIKFEERTKVLTINEVLTPYLNISKIIWNTSDKNWVNRLFNSQCKVTITNSNGGTYSDSISLGSLISPYHRFPVFEVNRIFNPLEFSSNFFSGENLSWEIKLELLGLDLETGESLEIHVIDNAQTNEITNKISNYLFGLGEIYSSYERIRISIDDTIVFTRFTFLNDFVSEKIEFVSELKFNNNIVRVFTEKDRINKLVSVSYDGDKGTANFDSLVKLIQDFCVAGYLFKEEEFGSKGDGLVYYLSRSLDRNASLLLYGLNAKSNQIIPEKLLEKIDSAFNITLKKIDIEFPKLCFVFRRNIISIARSHIFERDGKECLRILFDSDSYIPNIDQLSKIISIQVDLVNDNKDVFYSDKISLSDLLLNKKHIPQSWEVIPNTSDLIYSSSISIYINDKLYDSVKGAYIRNVKVNINIKQ